MDDVYALITALKLKKVHLVGHSMGAMVAGLFASCFNEYVKSVSFIEGIGCVTTQANEVASQLRNAILNRARLTIKKSRIYTSKEQIYQARAKTTDLSDELIALLMDRNIKQMHSGFELTTDPKLKKEVFSTLAKIETIILRSFPSPLSCFVVVYTSKQVMWLQCERHVGCATARAERNGVHYVREETNNQTNKQTKDATARVTRTGACYGT